MTGRYMMLELLKRWLGPDKHAPTPKARQTVLEPGVGRITPGKAFSQTASKNPMARPNDRYTDQSLSAIRYGKDPAEILQALSKWDPDVSAGIWNFVRVAESGWRIIALDKNGVPKANLQKKLDAIVMRLNWAQDYTQFTMPLSLDGMVSQMVKYAVLRGALAYELVLGEDRTVSEFAGVDPVRVNFKQPENGIYKPFMKDAQGKEVPLDFPTFIWEVLDPDVDSPFEQPMLLSAINAVMFRVSVYEDLQRVVKRTAFPRISVKLLEETMIENAPMEVKVDPDMLRDWLRARKNEIATELEAISPQDALVMWDSVEVDMLESGSNPTVDFRPLIQAIDQLVITAMKTLPTILGRNFSSSQTLSATETLLYTKSVAGLQRLVERAMSRMFTLALLLEGSQGVVQFKFNPVELRPLSELENQWAMRQARVLELLSLGFVTDEDAAQQLTGSPTLPPTYTPLSGTGFYGGSAKNGADDTQAGDTDSGTGADPRAAERTGGGRAPRGQT